jgi:hypothetical protein
MATLKTVSRSARLESIRGSVMVDTVRGVLRVRSWPKKRGTPKSALQRWWNDWFRQANLMTKYADAASQRRAIQITAGSGMYPRDIMLSAMRGRLYSWVDQRGKKWHSMAAIQDISDSLDVLAQSVGSVLVRAVDRWRSPDPGDFNDVLTYKGELLPAVWQAVSGGGGGGQEELPGYPIIPDNTVNEYILDVTSYTGINVCGVAFGMNGNDRIAFRFSTDGGITYHASAGEYSTGYVSANTDAWAATSWLDPSRVSSNLVHNCNINFTNLQAGRVAYQGGASYRVEVTYAVHGFVAFDGPVTHIKIFAILGNNFNAGSIRVTGIT